MRVVVCCAMSLRIWPRARFRSPALSAKYALLLPVGPPFCARHCKTQQGPIVWQVGVPGLVQPAGYVAVGKLGLVQSHWADSEWPCAKSWHPRTVLPPDV